MPSSSRTRELLIALFLLGALLFAPPLLIIFNKPTRILGIPSLYLYLFAVWAASSCWWPLAVERWHAEADDDEAGPEMPQGDPRPSAGGAELMLSGPIIISVALLYLCLLFAIAYYGDKRADQGRSLIANPDHLRPVHRRLLHVLDVLRLGRPGRVHAASASCRSISARR